MRKTLRRAVVLGLLAFAAPFAALPLAKPAAAMPEASAPVLPDAVDIPAATPQPVLPAVPESRSFDADAPILLNDGGEEITVSVQEFLIGTAASELPPDWPDDAVLAQMVATHSYALSLGGAAFTCNSAQCAGWTSVEVLRARWGGDFAAYYSRLAALADEVSGAVLCWDGAPAAACYHSSSAGQTEASQNVWLTAVPYLQGVRVVSNFAAFRQSATNTSAMHSSRSQGFCGRIRQRMPLTSGAYSSIAASRPSSGCACSRRVNSRSFMGGSSFFVVPTI